MTTRLPVSTVFLDRDGTINRKPPQGGYVTDWSQFAFLPGAKEAMALMSAAGLRLVIVTNQRGIALGRFTEDDLDEIHVRMKHEMWRTGSRLEAIYHCPHDRSSCECRKPGIGMFLTARRELTELEFEHSVMIGDAESDLEAAERVGASAIAIAKQPRAWTRRAISVQPSLWAAANWLLANDLG